MGNILNLSRRNMLKGVGATGALVLGGHLAPQGLFGEAEAAAAAAQPNFFVSIDKSGIVTLTCSRSEMGQGVRTGMPMIIADEMEADWNKVKIWQAPGDPVKYDPPGKDKQNTDGSRSTRHGFESMRELGASARYVLAQAAAKKWNVDVALVYAKDHRVYHSGSGKSFGFGELVEEAAKIKLPEGESKPPLKNPADWKYIGKDMPVVDNFDITTGGANFGADISIPGMKIAVVARAPVFRGKVKSFDATAALKIQGVDHVIEIPALDDKKGPEFRALGGVAVVGSNTWSVIKGREALKIEWDLGPNVAHDSTTYDDKLRVSAKTGGMVLRNRGNVDKAFASAAKVVEADYFVPYFVHTPMEPPAAIVDATVKPVMCWAPTQSPNQARQYVAEAIGVDIKDVHCEVTLLGGAFGRKSQADFICEAAILSKLVDAPVRVQWTREDEIRNGYYHAASAQSLKAALDDKGKVTAWRQSGAWPSILGLWNPAAKNGFPIEFGMGYVDMPYDNVPNIRMENGKADIMQRIGWYRSVNNVQHAFAINCFANELAAAAGRDPLAFQLELIGSAEELDLTKDGVEKHWNYGDSIKDYPIMPKRLANVLKTVADKAGYGRKLPKGQGLGLACHRSFQSYVAAAVHVVVREDGSLHIPRVDYAIDCGRYVNPEGIRKQVEGGAVYGNTVARHGKVTHTKGVVDQSNFDTYPVSRISDAPLDVQVHIVEDYVHMKPCGVGEPVVPPYTPALMNAIFAATGKRIRQLPIGDQLA